MACRFHYGKSSRRLGLIRPHVAYRFGEMTLPAARHFRCQEPLVCVPDDFSERASVAEASVFKFPAPRMIFAVDLPEKFAISGDESEYLSDGQGERHSDMCFYTSVLNAQHKTGLSFLRTALDYLR